MKKSILFASCLWLLSLVAHCQTYMSVGYNGAYITHPGLETSISRSVKNQDPQKDVVSNDIRVGMSLGFYFHKNRHTALFLAPTIEWLHTSASGFQWGFNLPLGFMKTFLPSVYEVSGSSVESIQGTGPSDFFVMPGFRLGHTVEHGFIDEWYVRNKLLIVPGHPLQKSATYLFEFSIVKEINALTK